LGSGKTAVQLKQNQCKPHTTCWHVSMSVTSPPWAH
jgi:hypothetical protein